jgi:DNA-binding CsgD family transcriptional regulator
MVNKRAARATNIEPPRQELKIAAACLNLFPVMAFLTDSHNCIVGVNQAFARTIGDPVRDRLPWSSRFLPAAIIGPYRERFPRGREEIAQCLPGLYQEVDAGNLAPGTLRLIDDVLESEDELVRATNRTTREWDGTMVVKDSGGKMTLIREQVLPLEETPGRASGFHVSLWFPADQSTSAAAGRSTDAVAITAALTPRQLDIARLFASGMTADAVASAANISWRTARSHLEEIYDRLGVHSRAELATLMSRAGSV